ncbi:MAG: site-specific DNA-methyltransferase [Planctomycetota bacterium]|nr:MAG: site-specific DNA-methyltransferase [Planctomycetota bacterium]
MITFVKTSGKGGALLDAVNDFLLWYAKDRSRVKYRQLYLEKELGKEGTKGYQHVELLDGTRRRLTGVELQSSSPLPDGARVFMAGDLTSQEAGSTTFEYEFEKRLFHPGQNSHWKTNIEGLDRLREAGRLFVVGSTLRYLRYVADVPCRELTNIWTDTGIAGYGDPKLYAVQTNTKVVERCILMTTDPGDLVFDPTCGSGTTAYCSEKWGRRWITCDTSRVAIAIARQRLLTAKFDYYVLKDPERGPSGGFEYETVPHITLKSIAQNTEIDKIAAEFNPKIEAALADLNRTLGKEWREWEVPPEIPHPLWAKEAHNAYWALLKLKRKKTLKPEEKQEANALLEQIYRLTGRRWESLNKVPEPVPSEDWGDEAREALRRFWELKRQKRRRIDESIQRNATQEVLYDRPKKDGSKVRVSGPFTVEAIPAPVVRLPEEVKEEQKQKEEEQVSVGRPDNEQTDYIGGLIEGLRKAGGINFGGKKLPLRNLREGHGVIHAEAETEQNGDKKRVALSFGPKYGPVTTRQVQQAVRDAYAGGYDMLIVAGTAIDPEARAFVQKTNLAVPTHFAQLAPDIFNADLKTTRASEIATVFGEPDVELKQHKDGTYVVRLRGVDTYDPLTGEVTHTDGREVAAWFLDTDYDGLVFHICQAFFPRDGKAWQKLQRALKAYIEPEVFEKMRGVESLPFKVGENRRVAVKVIDIRGIETLRILPLKEGTK